MFIPPKNEEEEEIMRQYNYAMQVSDELIRRQKRYKELLVLTEHINRTDKKEYETELKHNIESHIYDVFFFKQKPEIHQILLDFVKEHNYLKNLPDLNFAQNNNLKKKEDM